MPQWSVAEWRARIGGSWLAIGRPIKSKSASSSCGARCMQQVLTMNRVVTMMSLTLILIGVNLLLRALLNRGHLCPLNDLLKFGILSHWNLYWINSDYPLLTISTALSLHEFFPSAIIMYLRHFACSLKQGFYFTSRLFCVLASLKGPLVRPLLLLANLISCKAKDNYNSLRAVSVMSVMLMASDQIAMSEPNSSAVKEELELKRLGSLAVSNVLLDIVLSVTVYVITYKLLKSGDVEKNPGPENLDYDSVDTSKGLDNDDLCCVIEEVVSIQSRYYSLGRSLGLKNSDLKSICDKYPSDSEQALEDVLLLWLNQTYNVDRFGPPTWKMLVKAVDMETGGNDHKLAEQIASRHPATAAHKECLTTHDMREVIDTLWDYRAKWRLIGIQMGIELGDLDAIGKSKREDVDDALIEVTKHWLCNANPKPNRAMLTAIIESKCITKPTSAQGCDEVYAQYLKLLYKAQTLASSPDDDQWPPPCTDKVFRLAMIKNEEIRRGHTANDSVLREKTISGIVDDVLKRMVPVKMEDIFKVKDQLKEVKKVLIEGAPGSGKSTLSFHMCREWMEGHLFQEYKLVILMRLRESAVQNAKSLKELLPRRNEAMGIEAEDTITASDGKDILFIIDGWDELPPNVPAYSLILDVLKGKMLPATSIIVTSRPTSSAILHQPVHLHIVILGFTKDELELYFTKCLENCTDAAQRLLERIKQNPIIEGSCYLPLNASILVHLFKCRDNVLPTTQYGIFTDLVCTCIFRHLKKTHQDVVELRSLDELPPSTADQFKHLCQIAYDGLMQDKVIFDLGPKFNTLGLLQGVESFAICGKSYSYNFLHLSIQELLCALHMVNELDEREQTEQFKKLFGQARFMMVFQFFAAKTKLKTSGISEVVTEVAKKCTGDSPSHEDRTLLVSLMHCLFEAQDSSLCQLVADTLNHKLILGHTSLNPTDCYYLNYFLRFCTDFNICLSSCSIDADHCKSLFRREEVYNFCSLNFSGNSIGKEGVMAVAAIMKTASNLQELDLASNDIGINGVVTLAVAMKTATNLQKLYLGNNNICYEGAKTLAAALKTSNIQALDLSKNAIGKEGAMALAEALKTITNLQVLNLSDNAIGKEGAIAVAAALKTASNLQELDLHSNNIGNEGTMALATATTNLQVLRLNSNFIYNPGAMALAVALKKATNLRELCLSDNFIIGEGAVSVAEAMETATNLQELYLADNLIGDEGAVALAAVILRATNLQKLSLGCNVILKEGAIALAIAMETATNIQELDLGSNGIGNEGATAVMKTATNLRKLSLDNNNIRTEGAKTLAAAMETATNLQYLNLTQNFIGIEGKDAIEAVAKKTGTKARVYE